MVQSVAHPLHGFVALVCVRVDRKAKPVHGLALRVDNIGDKALAPVLRQGACDPRFSSLVHQGPGHQRPIRPQQTEARKAPDTALDEPLAPRIASKQPKFVQKG